MIKKIFCFLLLFVCFASLAVNNSFLEKKHNKWVSKIEQFGVVNIPVVYTRATSCDIEILKPILEFQYSPFNKGVFPRIKFIGLKSMLFNQPTYLISYIVIYKSRFSEPYFSIGIPSINDFALNLDFDFHDNYVEDFSAGKDLSLCIREAHDTSNRKVCMIFSLNGFTASYLRGFNLLKDLSK